MSNLYEDALQKSIQMVLEKGDSHIGTSVDELRRLYGANAQGIYDSIVEEKAKQIIDATTPEVLVAEENLDQFIELLGEAGVEDIYSRTGPKSITVTFDFLNCNDLIDEGLKIIFSGHDIDCYVGKEFVCTAESLEELAEAVDLDMRTRKFRNVMRRRCGEKYSREVEKVDMRRRGFKEALKRAETRKQKKELKEKDKELAQEGMNGSFDMTRAEVVSVSLKKIFDFIESQDDLDKLLYTVKKIGIDPLPLKHEIQADAERVYNNRHVSSDMSYVIKHIDEYLKIAEKLFDIEDEKEKEKEKEKKEPEDKDSKEEPKEHNLLTDERYENDPVLRILKKFNK